MLKSFGSALAACVLAVLVNACTTLVAPYDPTFDTALNTLSENTATFLAGAEAREAEQSYRSRAAVAYYASTYNVLDRLSERARLTRAAVPCPTNKTLASFVSEVPEKVALPSDYTAFDCREFQLYSVRFYVGQLDYAHQSGGTLNGSEARAVGGALQIAILGAIQTFVTNKPSK